MVIKQSQRLPEKEKCKAKLKSRFFTKHQYF